MLDMLFKQLYKSSLRFLGIRLRSVYEMRQKLHVWLQRYDDLSSADKQYVVNRVISQLIQDRFLDDFRFACEWIISRTRFHPRGEAVIRAELLHKGVDPSIVDSAFSSVGRQCDTGNCDFLSDSALLVGRKYWRKYSALPLREGKYKLVSALLRKGYSREIIDRVVDELLKNS